MIITCAREKREERTGKETRGWKRTNAVFKELRRPPLSARRRAGGRGTGSRHGYRVFTELKTLGPTRSDEDGTIESEKEEKGENIQTEREREGGSRKRARERAKEDEEQGRESYGGGGGGGSKEEYLLISLQSGCCGRFLRTHDTGRESKGEFTRCVYLTPAVSGPREDPLSHGNGRWALGP